MHKHECTIYKIKLLVYQTTITSSGLKDRGDWVSFIQEMCTETSRGLLMKQLLQKSEPTSICRETDLEGRCTDVMVSGSEYICLQ